MATIWAESPFSKHWFIIVVPTATKNDRIAFNKFRFQVMSHRCCLIFYFNKRIPYIKAECVYMDQVQKSKIELYHSTFLIPPLPCPACI